MTSVDDSKQVTNADQFAQYQARLHAEEIDFLARETHDTELQKLIEQQHSKLHADYELECNNIDRESKINFSIAKNEQRIRVLSIQKDIVSQAQEKTRQKLREYHDSPQYKEGLTKLIKQGVLQLNEPKVTIHVIEKDVGLAKQCLSDAMSQIGNTISCTATVAEENYLSNDKIGGCIIMNDSETIRCDNSFEGRLQLATEGSLPNISMILKGQA